MKQVTLKDIAKEAGVSITTVSKALSGHPDISEATRKRVKDLCDLYHYIPNANASFLRKKKTNLIGVVVSDFSNPFFAEMLKTVEDELTKRGYYMLILNTNEDERQELECINELRSINVAGIIITPVSEKSIDLLNKTGVPFVVAVRPTRESGVSSVAADERKAGYLAACEVLGSKPEARYYLLGPRLTISSFKDKVDGYLEAMREHHVAGVENTIVTGVYSNVDGYRTAEDILGQHGAPYAFLCESDYIAIGVTKCLIEHGISIPKQAVVMGMDNLSIFAYTHPLLSTVDVRTEEMAVKCVEVLFDKIDVYDKKLPFTERQVVLEPRVIRRETC